MENFWRFFLENYVKFHLKYRWWWGKKANLKTGVTRKQSTPNFPEYENLLRLDTHTCVCVSGGKKCLFFGKFSVICFLVTTFLRFALLSYRRINIIILAFHYAHKVTKKAGIRQENMITQTDLTNNAILTR